MRIVPDTLASRIALLLICGFGLAAAATFFVSGWGDASRLLERIAATAVVLDRAPAAGRPALAASLSAAGAVYTWREGSGLPQLQQRDWTTHHLARDLRAALAGSGLDRVEAGYADALRPSIVAEGTSAELVVAWIGMRDGSWTRVAIDSERIGALRPLRIGVTAAVIVTLLVLLAWWSSRRVTAPLREFTAAAHRLGANVEASPLAESGPNEIREAARTFNCMQRQIRALIDERTLMLAAISHDLRTSLTRLRLRAESIPEGPQRDKATRDLDEMGAVLAATLAFAKGNGAAEPKVRVDLAVLLQSLCDEAADAGERVTYVGPAHMTFQGQATALRRAFDNLIGNAVKYGGEARVELRLADDTIAIDIADRGPGIAAELRQRVFEPYFRVESSRSRETGGVGLGLTVAQRVVGEHGGRFALRDREGGGLVLRVVLPLGGPRIDSMAGPKWTPPDVEDPAQTFSRVAPRLLERSLAGAGFGDIGAFWRVDVRWVGGSVDEFLRSYRLDGGGLGLPGLASCASAGRPT